MKMPKLNLPKQLSSNNPAVRALLAVMSIVFIVVQVFGNLHDSALRQSMKPLRTAFDTVGLYERGWGMFAATNSQTSVARSEHIYADGSIVHIQHIFLRPGYKLSALNEVMQDIMYDDNNDKAGHYLNGFLTYSCQKYDTRPGNPLLSVAVQRQVSKFPMSKRMAEETVPFITIQNKVCTETGVNVQ